MPNLPSIPKGDTRITYSTSRPTGPRAVAAERGRVVGGISQNPQKRGGVWKWKPPPSSSGPLSYSRRALGGVAVAYSSTSTSQDGDPNLATAGPVPRRRARRDRAPAGRLDPRRTSARSSAFSSPRPGGRRRNTEHRLAPPQSGAGGGAARAADAVFIPPSRDCASGWRTSRACSRASARRSPGSGSLDTGSAMIATAGLSSARRGELAELPPLSIDPAAEAHADEPLQRSPAVARRRA